MTTIRPFEAEDLFRFNHINLDPLTGRFIMLLYNKIAIRHYYHPFCRNISETYSNSFYMEYISNWPAMCATYNDPSGRMMG